MTPEPWIIDELEEERRRRDSDEMARQSRIELPQILPHQPPGEKAEEARPAHNTGVTIVEISPGNDNTFSL